MRLPRQDGRCGPLARGSEAAVRIGGGKLAVECDPDGVVVLPHDDVDRRLRLRLEIDRRTRRRLDLERLVRSAREHCRGHPQGGEATPKATKSASPASATAAKRSSLRFTNPPFSTRPPPRRGSARARSRERTLSFARCASVAGTVRSPGRARPRPPGSSGPLRRASRRARSAAVRPFALRREPESRPHRSRECYGRWPCACSLAQLSLSPSVRLKTSRPGDESGSGQK